MASYNRIKAQKASPIGTMMPWGGNGAQGASEDNIPVGWITCRGQTLRALDYPLLAQIIGNTYGPFAEPGQPFIGISNQYPNYTDADIFNLPNINGRSLIDIEAARLDPSTLLKVGEYITENGADAEPPTNVQAYVNILFQVEPAADLAGKVVGIDLEDPAYFDTIRTIPRKLGVDHTPSHSHSQPEGEQYTSAALSGYYAGVFEAGNFETQDNEWLTGSDTGLNDSEPNADRFDDTNGGIRRVTWYDADNQSLVSLENFKDTTNASAVLPVVKTRNIPSYGNTASFADGGTAIAGQQQPAFTGPFPFGGTYQGFRNHYDTTDTAAEIGQDETKTYPVCLNHNADSFASNSMASHNHFTVDISMNRGQMNLPTNILINNMTTGTLQATSVDSALSVQMNPNTPSLTTMMIMRAY